MAFRSPSALNLASRTVHVKIYPTVRSFAERREVLRVLEQFGEVAMFRSFKYHPSMPVPNAFLTLFNTESAATKALNQSPIRYRLMPVSSEPDAPPLDSTVEESDASKQSPEDEKIFELHVSTTTFDHDKYLNSPASNPLHGPYQPVSPATSYIASSLDEVIPPSLWAPGLKDWETDGFRVTDRETPDSEALSQQGDLSLEGTGKASSNRRTSIEWKVSQRERKRLQMAIPEIMKGLRPMKEAYEKRQQSNTQASQNG
ncbi:hypothetical protein LHYA1_G000038 [Lachnellula hyalina]|uniref:Uncharacterized protein n=1 Tax=Lachnellula hyalina TaxID=1316788 RepID=A0A8H8U257_9HELO|nr:uncharacterized protein LHYA1_G000038 [Lachnellula hyalina]TVY31122.1 hypothetical protein LHYA1_G000038 [Lachnellula hyalina]